MSLSGADIAIDLGTAFTRIGIPGAVSLAADEPSLVRVRPGSEFAEAVGRRALEGEARGVLRAALHGGVIVDLEAAVMLLQKLLWRFRGSPLVRPSVLLCAPSDASAAECALLTEAATRAGAASVRLVPEPLAAAVGGGLDLASPCPQLVVDVGEGVTDVGLIEGGRLAGSWAVRGGCAALRESVRDALAEAHGLLLTASEAERAVSAALVQGSEGVRVAGRHRASGCERQPVVCRALLATAVEPVLGAIGRTLQQAWSDLSTRSSCHVIESGVLLVGGGALVPGLRERLAADSSLDVRVARNPLHAVVAGARRFAAG